MNNAVVDFDKLDEFTARGFLKVSELSNVVIDNDVMGRSNLFWKREWIYLNGSNMEKSPPATKFRRGLFKYQEILIILPIEPLEVPIR